MLHWLNFLKSNNYVAPVLAFCLPALLYIFTLSPTISVGDSPELTASAFTLGIAHPPGYPLFSLIGKGSSFLPVGDSISYRINLLSAILGSFSVLFLYLSIIEVISLIRKGEAVGSADRFSSFLASLTFALSSIFWSQSVAAEVYTLNSALFTGLLWLGLRWMNAVQSQGFPNSRLLYLIAFLWGMGIGNHHTIIAFGPVFLVFAGIYSVGAGLAPAQEGQPQGLPLRLTPHPSLLILFFLLGLSVYLYLPIRSGQNPFMDWGDTERLSGFLEVLSREQFGLGSRDYSVERTMAQTFHYLTLLREQFTLPGLTLGCAGFIVLARRNFLAAIFTLTLFLAHGIMTILFLNPAFIDLGTTDVMVIPSLAAFSIWIGIGLLFVLKGMIAIFTKGLTGKIERNITVIFTLVSLLIPSTLLYSNLYNNNRRDNTFAYDYAADIFSGIEQDGILFVDTDLSLFPLWYMQYVEGKRLDVAVLNVDMLMLPWFKRELGNKYPGLGIKVPDVMRHSKGRKYKPLSMEAIVSYKVSQVEEMLDGLMDSRSVYLSYDFGIPFKEFGERTDVYLVENGITFRVSKEKVMGEVISDSPALKSLLKTISSMDEEVLFISRGYVPAMEITASRELASGNKNRAAEWMEAILKVDPYNASILNNLAFIFAEDGKNLLMAENMVKKALSINPKERGRYLKTLGYIYLKRGEYLMARETFIKVLQIEPASEWARQKLEEASSVARD